MQSADLSCKSTHYKITCVKKTKTPCHIKKQSALSKYIGYQKGTKLEQFSNHDCHYDTLTPLKTRIA